ncbi:MAG: glycosyltransferase [Candidatus Omnitrophica bacterium]|nr:glycosyltransferase [Candidatus Omnitrophota bacterium]
MTDSAEKICLVVPCYNEAQRLDCKKFKEWEQDYWLLFVNDGSNDNTVEILRDNLKKNVYILDLKKNVGKAEAIRQGMLYLKILPIFEEISWFGYWDADLATPLREIDNFFRYGKALHPEADAIIGSRIIKLGSNIRRTLKRYFLGRLFANIASIALKLDIYDSQCGAKLFKKELIDKCFAEPFISKWIFDVEIILRMQQQKIVEYPLKEWEDKTGGHLRICSVAVQTVIDLIRLRRKYLNKDKIIRPVR